MGVCWPPAGGLRRGNLCDWLETYLAFSNWSSVGREAKLREAGVINQVLAFGASCYEGSCLTCWARCCRLRAIVHLCISVPQLGETKLAGCSMPQGLAAVAGAPRGPEDVHVERVPHQPVIAGSCPVWRPSSSTRSMMR